MSEKKTFAIISLICSIVSIVLGCVGFGLIFAIAGLVFFIISKKKGENANVLQIIALILSIIGIIAGIGSIIGYSILGATAIFDTLKYMN